MDRNQETWYRRNLARRQAMVAAVMRMRAAAAGGGGKGDGGGADGGIVVPDIPPPERTTATLRDGRVMSAYDEGYQELAGETVRIEYGRDTLETQGAVVTLENLSYSNMPYLSAIVIPDGFESVSISMQDWPGEGGGVREMTIPNTVTALALDCPTLKTLKIGSGVSSMFDEEEGFLVHFPGQGAVDVQISKDNQSYKTDGKFVLSKDGTEAYAYFGGESSVRVPDGVESIKPMTFSGYGWLTDVTMPDSVESIGYSAFSNCSGLTGVTIPDGVTSVGNSAFWRCRGLTNVAIGGNVASVGDYAFGQCYNLANVAIGDGVESIGEGAFYGCSSLTGVVIPGSATFIGEHAFYGCGGEIHVYMSWMPGSDVQQMDGYQWGLAEGAVIHCSDGDIVIGSEVS